MEAPAARPLSLAAEEADVVAPPKVEPQELNANVARHIIMILNLFIMVSIVGFVIFCDAKIHFFLHS